MSYLCTVLGLLTKGRTRAWGEGRPMRSTKGDGQRTRKCGSSRDRSGPLIRLAPFRSRNRRGGNHPGWPSSSGFREAAGTCRSLSSSGLLDLVVDCVTISRIAGSSGNTRKSESETVTTIEIVIMRIEERGRASAARPLVKRHGWALRQRLHFFSFGQLFPVPFRSSVFCPFAGKR